MIAREKQREAEALRTVNKYMCEINSKYIVYTHHHNGLNKYITHIICNTKYICDIIYNRYLNRLCSLLSNSKYFSTCHTV